MSSNQLKRHTFITLAAHGCGLLILNKRTIVSGVRALLTKSFLISHWVQYARSNLMALENRYWTAFNRPWRWLIHKQFSSKQKRSVECNSAFYGQSTMSHSYTTDKVMLLSKCDPLDIVRQCTKHGNVQSIVELFPHCVHGFIAIIWVDCKLKMWQ